MIAIALINGHYQENPPLISRPILTNYLWGVKITNKNRKNKKYAKVKHTTIIAPIEKGGLGMVDIYAVHTASKCSWIRRLYNNSESKCKHSTWSMLNFEPHLLNKNCTTYELKKHCKTKFHKQMIEEWIKLNTSVPKTGEEMLNQFIIYNQYIKIGKEIIPSRYFDPMDCNIQLNDILDVNGNMFSKNILNTKLKKQLSTIQYNSLITSIPRKWKKIIKTKIGQIDRNKIIAQSIPMIQFKNTKKSIEKITSKEIYQIIISKKIEEPTSIETWTERFPFLVNLEWSKIYKLPFQTTCEPYLQSLQYKILNRVINCKDKLYKWNILKNNECIYCGKIDTIEHHIFECEETKLFWNRLQDWMSDTLEVSIRLTICEVLFGIPMPDNPDIEAINYITMVGKWYINANRTNEKALYMLEFLELLKGKMEATLEGNKMFNRPNKEWQENIYKEL